MNLEEEEVNTINLLFHQTISFIATSSSFDDYMIIVGVFWGPDISMHTKTSPYTTHCSVKCSDPAWDFSSSLSFSSFSPHQCRPHLYFWSIFSAFNSSTWRTKCSLAAPHVPPSDRCSCEDIMKDIYLFHLSVVRMSYSCKFTLPVQQLTWSQTSFLTVSKDTKRVREISAIDQTWCECLFPPHQDKVKQMSKLQKLFSARYDMNPETWVGVEPYLPRVL